MRIVVQNQASGGLGKKTIYGWALVTRRREAVRECYQSLRLFGSVIITMGYA